MRIRTRIAPSPTGIAHIGTAYMALFNYAYAIKNDGEFIIRIEDTDRARFVEGAEDVIYDALRWLEIPYMEAPDKGGPFAPYRQSERLTVYKEHVDTLVASGHAYYCFCTPERLEAMRAQQQANKQIPRYDRTCLHLSKDEIASRLSKGEKHVIRMKMPDNEIITWEDKIRGHVEINTKELDDQVLLKSDGFPTYHLAVVVDDHRMEISTIIRGEEWISSTPKHILLYRFFGWQLPEFAHMPLLRNPDKTKMSKRKNDVSIPSYREKGYLPEALRNYLCLLGWSHPEGKDVFSLNEFIDTFSMDRMVKSGPIFDIAKLNWMNGKYIREVLSTAELTEKLQEYIAPDYPQELLPKVLPLVRDRLVTLNDINELSEFFYKDISHSKELLVPKKTTPEEAKVFLEASLSQFQSVPDSAWDATSMETRLREYCDSQGWNRGAFFMALRVAVTGRTATPPLFDTIAILGKQTTLDRIQAALHTLDS